MNVLMLHQGRCGSTVLGDLLSQHPAVHWDGEIYYTSNWMPASQPIEEIVYPGDGLDLLSKKISTCERDIYGFEVQTQCIVPMHMSIAAYVDRCADLGFSHFIHLGRRNLLRKVISSLVLLARNQWHYRPGEQPPPTKVSVSIERLALKNTVQPLLKFMESMESKVAEIQAAFAGRRALDLIYEDDIDVAPHAGYLRACAFLNISPVPATIRYVRATPRPMCETVENWSEVCTALAGTKYEWMFLENPAI